MHYEEELRALRIQYESGALPLAEYQALLNQKMNDTSPETMNAVKQKMMAILTRKILRCQKAEICPSGAVVKCLRTLLCPKISQCPKV